MIMKPMISAIAGLFVLFMMIMPATGMADTVVTPQGQPAYGMIYQTAYWGHHYSGCRDPHFRRHHRWLCW
jgi:hypothetical protein